METSDTATPKLFIGIDIHKRSWKVQTATDLFVGRGHSMPPDPAVLKKYVEENFPGHQVHLFYEAGPKGTPAKRAGTVEILINNKGQKDPKGMLPFIIDLSRLQRDSNSL